MIHVPHAVGIGSVNVTSLSVSPNPASTFVGIVIYHPKGGAVVTLTDLSGRVVISTPLVRILDVSTIPSGCYSLRVTTADSILAAKVVIAR